MMNIETMKMREEIKNHLTEGIIPFWKVGIEARKRTRRLECCAAPAGQLPIKKPRARNRNGSHLRALP